MRVKLLAALSSLSLAATYLLTWAGIRVFDAGSSVRYLGYLVVAEFIQLIFALPLVILLVGPLREEAQSRPHRGLFWAMVGTLAMGLGIAGLALSLSAGAAWPMIAVVLLLAGKLNLYLRPPATVLESRRIMADSVVRVAVLFFLLLPCALIPFPAWNLPASMEEFGDFRPSGLMILGASYFGLFGLFGHRLDDLVDAEPDPASVSRKEQPSA